jgi:hypothetical protein
MQTIDVEIEIALPAERDKAVSIYSLKTKEPEILNSLSVGIGTIQVIEQLGDSKSSHRHQFIVTRLPDDENSLIGFFLVDSYVYAIRADLWKKNKSFLYFDSFNNEVVRGTCH